MSQNPPSVDSAPSLDTEGAELRKPHEMIVMVPRSRRVTLTGRRLYNALLQVSQSRMSAMDAMPQADFMFEAPLVALLRTSGSSGEDRTAAKRYLREMRGLEVDWESTAPGDGVKWRGFSMLSEVAIEVRNGDNWVSWSYPPTVMSVIRDPARWARIDLNVIARLGTYTAVALYEICARYRDNPGGVTSRKPVGWWSDALSQSAGAGERREWRKFKNEKVLPAIDEINKETDLEIELIEHKQGRTVAEAQFGVRRRRRPAGRAEGAGVPIDANLVLRAESLGVRELKLEGLIREYGDDAVRQKVDVLEQRFANNRLKGVENAYSYLRSLLRNDASDPASTTALAPGEGSARNVMGANAEADRAQSSAAETSAGEPTGPLDKNAWLNDRIAFVKSELASLDPAVRQAWAAKALAELAANHQLTAVVSRRAAQGDVLHGLLGSVVVRLYASARWGGDWDQEQRRIDASTPSPVTVA